jgi:hypothetical protein
MKKTVRFSDCSKEYDGLSDNKQAYIDFLIFFKKKYSENDIYIQYEIESYLKKKNRNIVDYFYQNMIQDYIKLKNKNKTIITLCKSTLTPDLIYPIERFILPILNVKHKNNNIIF